MAPRSYSDSMCLFFDDEPDESQNDLNRYSSFSYAASSKVIQPIAPLRDDEALKKKNKSVRFHPTCQIKYFRMPPREDRENAWYNKVNYATFRRENKQILQAATSSNSHHWLSFTPLQDNNNNNNNNSNGDSTLLGLEHFLPEEVQFRAVRREAAKNVVEEMQDIMAPERMAQLYANVTSQSRLVARRTAVLLETTL